MKINKRYFVLYRITGDSSISNKGLYFEASDNEEKLIKKIKGFGDFCDDRQNISLISTNVYRGY